MLRITRQPGADRDTLLLEGKLLKEWIEELQEALAQTRRDTAATILDLSGLRFVDEEGASFLRECRRRGALLLRAPPFVSALLDPPPQRRVTVTPSSLIMIIGYKSPCAVLVHHHDASRYPLFRIGAPYSDGVPP